LDYPQQRQALTVAAIVLSFSKELVGSSFKKIEIALNQALSFDKDRKIGVKFKVTEVLVG